MKRIHWYLFKKNLIYTSAFLCVFVGMIWLFQSLRFMDIIVDYRVSILQYIRLVLCLFPDLIGVCIPISFTLGTLSTYQHKKSLAYFAKSTLALPFLLTSIVLVSLSFLNHAYWSSFAYANLRKSEHEIKSHFSQNMLKKGEFRFISNTVIYIKDISKNQKLMGIFIQKPDQFVIAAESGSVDVYHNQIILDIHHGYYKDTNGNTFFFQKFKFDLTPYLTFTKNLTTRPYEKPLFNLLSSNNKEWLKEGYQRMLMILFPMIIFIIGYFIIFPSFHNRLYFAKSLVFLMLVLGLQAGTFFIFHR